MVVVGEMDTVYSNSGPFGTFTGKKFARNFMFFPAVPKPGLRGSSSGCKLIFWKEETKALSELSNKRASIFAACPGANMLRN